MMTADIYTAKNMYNEMIETEICLVTTKKNLSPMQVSAIATDFAKMMEWIENDKTLTKEDVMYFIAWDFAVTIAVIKDILQGII